MTFLGGGELSEERMLTLVDRSPEAISFYRILRHPVPADRRAGRSLFRRGGRRARRRAARSRPNSFPVSSSANGATWCGRPRTRPTSSPPRSSMPGAASTAIPTWDQDLVRDRRAKDMRGKGVGLVTSFRQAVAGARRADPSRQRGRWPDGRGRPGDRRANGGRHDPAGAKGRRAWRPAATNGTPS